MANWPAMMTGQHLDELSGRRGSALGALAISKSKPKVEITLDDQQAGCFVPSYTTLDRIHGTVTITFPTDTQFEAVHVIFQGASKTFVDKIASTSHTPPRTHAYHQFLRLVQPMDHIELPEDGLFRAGTTQAIPFTFVVPERLLPQSCTHKVEHESLRETHRELPPSLGDPMMAGDGRSLMDDLAPPMTMISYGIRVIMTRREGNKPRAIADAMKKLRIVPATDEQPPLRVEDGVDDYNLRRVKSIKKGMFKGKLGTLTMTTEQPAPLRLPFIRAKAANAASTVATIDLLFEPQTATAKPPSLGQLWVKLKVCNYFATAPMREIPARASFFTYDPQRGVFVETVPLSSRRVESVAWTKHAGSPPRRDSGVAGVPLSPSSSPPAACAAPPPWSPAGVHYTARIVVPVDLSTAAKSFVSTFHTCLASRLYVLDLAVSAHPAGIGAASTLHCKVPLQILQAGNDAAQPLISAGEAAHIRSRAAAAAATQRRASVRSQDGDDASSGMADLTLRGARGSVFQPPRWGSVSWGGADHPRSALAAAAHRGQSSGSEEEDEDEEEALEGRRAMAEVLEDEAAQTHRVQADDEPPSYTPVNGVITRTRGVHTWHVT